MGREGLVGIGAPLRLRCTLSRLVSMRTGEKVRHNGYMGEYLPTGSDKEPEPRLSEAELERAAWSSDDALPPDGDAVGRFWEEARRAAGFTRLDVVVGSTPSAMVPPR